MNEPEQCGLKYGNKEVMQSDVLLAEIREKQARLAHNIATPTFSNGRYIRGQKEETYFFDESRISDDLRKNNVCRMAQDISMDGGQGVSFKIVEVIRRNSLMRNERELEQRSCVISVRDCTLASDLSRI